MIKERKTLKEYSIVILVFAALSFARIIIDAITHGFGSQALNVEGVPENVAQIVAIIIFVMALLLLLPDVYVGVKGMKESNNPTGARAHIVWALILAILSLVGTVSSLGDMIKEFDFDKLLLVLDLAVDVVLFFAYYLVAKKIANNK